MSDILEQIAEVIRSPEALGLPAELLRRAEAVLGEQAIELSEGRASGKQRAFQQAFFARQDPSGRPCGLFAALGGNRSGKSYVCGWLCFAKFLRDRAAGGDWFWCISQTLDRSVGGQQRELWQALPRRLFGQQTWGEKIGFGMHRKVILPTGDGGRCLVEFRSADQDPSTFEQAKLTGAWCDERLSEEIFNRLLARIVDRNGFILYSDLPEQAWQLYRLIEAPPEAGVHCQSLSMYDNAHNLPPGAIELATARMTQDEQKLRIGGEFVVMEGVVYREYQDTIHAIAPFAIPEAWPRWRMIDYGASAPTACLWAAVAPNETIYIYREHYQRHKSIAENAKMILAASGSETYRGNLIDPCAGYLQPGLTQTIAQQYAAAGITPLRGWPRVNEMGEHAMVQKVKHRLENNRLKVFQSCPNCRREFRSWKYQTDSDGRPLAADAFEQGNDHTLDCIKGFVATLPTFQRPRIRVIEG